MRTCPTCAARYEAPAQYCQVDGASLVVDGPSTDPYLGKKILEQFRLERVVGSGGMGVVYEGLDEGLGRRVAVKILHRDLVTNKDIVQRFHREAQIAHQLDHPGIVRVVLFGQLADGNLYLVLEFLEGPTLMQALEADGTFAPARAVKVMCDVADAVGYTHARGIVHRDLKPENIILTRRGDDPEFAKILDFGIAKTLIGSGSFVTQTGLIFGTARYISPEGASGEPVDQRGDVYSLGVIAYQLLTGHTPFESDEPMQLLLKHIHEPAPSMRTYRPGLSVPLALEAVVMRSLAKNPDARFDDGNAFARALREAAGAGGLEVRSLVATSTMGAFAPSPVAITAQGRGPALQRETLDDGAPAAEPARAAAVPVSAVESSGVARVRTVSRGSLPTYNQAALANGAVAAPATLPSPNLPARMELPVVAPPAEGLPRAEDVSVASIASAIRTRPTAEEFVDPDEFPVIARRGGAGRTFAVVVTSVVLTVLVALGGAWGLRMFPQQRREDEIAGLLRRANDALLLGRYAHAPDNNDVEDLTDAVIALDPRNQRAFAQRHSAALRLKVSSDAERQAGHPERAIPLLQDALRLEDDPTLHDELAAAQREVEAQRNAATPTPTPRATPRTAPRTTPRVAPRDPTLDHPPEPVVPLNPAVAPTPPAPEAPRAHTQRPRRDGGQVVQTPPDDDMRIVIPGTNIAVPIFGSQPQSPPPPPPDDPGGRTAVF